MDQAWWYSLVLLFFFLLASTKLFLLKQTPVNHLPPSPFALPIIGHLHLIKGSLHRTLSSLSNKYGPVLHLQFGFRTVFVITSPSAVEECFTKNDIIFANRPRLLSGKHLNYDYTTIGAASYGHHWRNLRRFTALQIFSMNCLNKSSLIRQDEIRLLLGKLFKDAQHGFAKVELKSRFSELAFNIIIRMVAGKRYYGDDLEDLEEASQFRDIISENFELSGASNPGDFVPFLQWIDYYGLERRMLTLKAKTDTFLQSLIDECRCSRESNSSCSLQSGNSTLQEETKTTMIDVMLSLQETEPENYTDTTIKGIILILLIAGTDTTSVTIEWAMSLLLNHQEVLKKAKAELHTNVGHDRLMDESDLPRLPYLQGIINETLRLFPAVPLLSPHESSDDCTIGEFDVPKGTVLIINAWAIHRDPKLWEDPNSFKPERFGEMGGEAKKWLIPFGLGRRGCPGSGLANRVVGLALGTLIQCFEWERVSEEEVDMTEGAGLSMPKAKPLEAMCKAHQAMIYTLSGL
ncbi:hypothetical protein NE237_009235 [Protea cynaroides]|uniref:Cytochrome P450 n=1 Tax=Protea cynaroides TaxID=273540 RepID=A0A9Q0KXC4_9MAGN|nr:hypothetical protein NE237_009235 [Protea cynaroides]